MAVPSLMENPWIAMSPLHQDVEEFFLGRAFMSGPRELYAPC